ncbi:arginase family protein, partial [Vallitalea guaymasensis]
GLTAREAIQIIDYVSQSKKFMGADIVEYSPEDDTNGNTNQLVIKLIDTLVGYRM